ncbi:hypothetical protein EON65_22475 [archaeon]|nr:MAG: hypothetical protein EON65_22475 [archaeon]
MDHQVATGGNALHSLQVSIQSSSVLTLSRHFRPILQAQMSLHLGVHSVPGKWGVSAEVADIQVTDTLHAVNVYTSLLCVRGREIKSGIGGGLTGGKSGKEGLGGGTAPSALSLSVKQSDGNKISIHASALPVEIYINKHCIHAVILAFTVPTNTFEKKLKRVLSIHRDSNGAILQQAVLAGSQLSTQVMQEVRKHSNISAEILLELHAPKIIIPEDCAEDKGCLLLDSGFLSTKGVITSSGPSFSISLKAINAGLPISVHDLTSMADRSLYLIKVCICLSCAYLYCFCRFY